MTTKRQNPPSRVRRGIPFGRRVAHRRYRWRPPRGGPRAIDVEIGTPVKTGRDWACRIRITGLPRAEPLDQPIYGVDAVQALELALHAAGVMLSRSLEFCAGQIEAWGKPARTSADLGLPIPLHSLEGMLHSLSELLKRNASLRRHEQWRRALLAGMREIALDLATLAARLPSGPRRRQRTWERGA